MLCRCPLLKLFHDGQSSPVGRVTMRAITRLGISSGGGNGHGHAGGNVESPRREQGAAVVLEGLTSMQSLFFRELLFANGSKSGRSGPPQGDGRTRPPLIVLLFLFLFTV